MAIQPTSQSLAGRLAAVGGTALVGVLAFGAGPFLPVASAAPVAKAAAADQFVALTGQARKDAGVGALARKGDLDAVARAQAQRMATDEAIYHNPNLASDVDGWMEVGEIVGRGPDPMTIHEAFMGSPTHRQQILKASYTQIGVGVFLADDGMIYVSEVFRRPMSGGTPPPTTTPPPPPTTAPPTTAPPPPPTTAPPTTVAPKPAKAKSTATKPSGRRDGPAKGGAGSTSTTALDLTDGSRPVLAAAPVPSGTLGTPLVLVAVALMLGAGGATTAYGLRSLRAQPAPARDQRR